jgi:hypothetical protein
MRGYCLAIVIVFICSLTGGCASSEKKRAEFSGSSARGLAFCPKDYGFSDINEGVFFFSFVDNTLTPAEVHWEILNVDTGERFVFVSQGLVRIEGLTNKAKCSFAVPAGRYRLTKLFLTKFARGLVTGEKEYFQFCEFDIEPQKVAYLGHIVINDPNNPKGRDISMENWLKGARGMVTGSNIPEKLGLEVTDEYDNDIKWFQSRHEKLKNADFVTCLLRKVKE